MPKRAMSFKPTSECEVQLAELMDRFRFDRTSVVIMAVDIAHRQLFPEPKDPKEVAEVIARQKRDSELMLSKPDIVTGTHTVVLPGDPRVTVGHADKPTPSVRPVTEPKKDTRSQQQKTDDFYRANMAKGKK